MGTAGLLVLQSAAFAVAGALVFYARAHRPARAAIAFLAAGLTAGGVMHAVELVERGLVRDPAQPPAYNAFWAALALLDPLAALLLHVQPRAGIVLALGIMAFDIAVNAMAYPRYVSLASGPLWAHAAFTAFALVTARRVWRAANAASAAPAASGLPRGGAAPEGPKRCPSTPML